MTNPAQTLVRMIGFLIIVGIIAGFLYAPLVDAFLANPALNGMILAALLIGILFALRQVVRLRPDVAWLESFRRQQPGLSMIDAPRQKVVEERMKAHPDWIGYLITQEPEYRELKERCAAAAVRGEFPEGVATIEIAIEALKLAEYLTPLLSARLG